MRYLFFLAILLVLATAFLNHAQAQCAGGSCPAGGSAVHARAHASARITGRARLTGPVRNLIHRVFHRGG